MSIPYGRLDHETLKLMAVTNEALAERIEGAVRLLVEKIDQVDDKVDDLNVKVGIQNGRVTKLETANLVAKTERGVLERVATSDRQHNKDVEDASWTRWQKVLGAGGIACATLAGAGGLVELLQHL